MWLPISYLSRQRLRETDLVDSDPVLNSISKSLKQDLGVIYEIVDYLLADKSAVFLLES